MKFCRPCQVSTGSGSRVDSTHLSADLRDNQTPPSSQNGVATHAAVLQRYAPPAPRQRQPPFTRCTMSAGSVSCRTYLGERSHVHQRRATAVKPPAPHMRSPSGMSPRPSLPLLVYLAM